MKFVKYIFALIIFLTISSCGVSSESEMENNIINPEIPEQFQSLANPDKIDEDTIELGGNIFKSNCASCHGESGKGDGVVAKSLDPEPPNLSKSHPDRTDGYLFWRISEGGGFEPYSSSMPGWKTILSDEEIWHVISYIRSLN